tara:strand:+ start:535803 stop:536210 length:408 start_codon:yes stop_codon:yes gene_type:complete
MKKLILSLALIATFAISASALTGNDSKSTTNYNYEMATNFEPSTFCKLITKGDLDAVKSMIIAGADINEKSIGMTPLMYAARYNRVEIVNLLISKGADLKLKSNRGYTALDYAEMSKAHDTYKIISEAINSKESS